MFLHSTTDTGVQIRRTVLGQYTLYLDGAPIGAVFGDLEIGFTATSWDGMNLGRHTTLSGAATAVQTNLVNRVERNTRLQRDEETIWSGLHAVAPVSA